MRAEVRRALERAESMARNGFDADVSGWSVFADLVMQAVGDAVHRCQLVRPRLGDWVRASAATGAREWRWDFHDLHAPLPIVIMRPIRLGDLLVRKGGDDAMTITPDKLEAIRQSKMYGKTPHVFIHQVAQLSTPVDSDLEALEALWHMGGTLDYDTVDIDLEQTMLELRW